MSGLPPDLGAAPPAASRSVPSLLPAATPCMIGLFGWVLSVECHHVCVRQTRSVD